MGYFEKENEIVFAVSAEKMFKAIALDCDQIFPKVVPLESIEILEGDGGVGTIKKINFGGGEFKYAKEKIDLVDKEKLEYHFSWIEGDILRGMFEKVSYELKFKAKHDGGSVCKCKTKFFIIGDIQLEEDKMKAGEEKVVGLYKAVEAHILANP